MALTKTATVTMQNVNNAAAASTVSFTSQQIVADGKLAISYNTLNPGVFTAGTAPERTASNPNNDATA